MLKTVVDTLDGLDEAIQSLYSEADGKFVLQVEGIDLHPEVAPLKNAYERTKQDRDAARQERDEFKAKLSSVPDDFDAERWEKAKDGKADEAKLIEMRQTLEAERDEWKRKFEAEQAAQERRSINDAVSAALAAQGVPEGLRFGAGAQMLHGRTVTVENGNPIIDSGMGPMPLSDFAARWVAGDGAQYVPQPGGGGAPGSDASQTKQPPKSWAEAKTAKEKAELLKSKRE